MAQLLALPECSTTKKKSISSYSKVGINMEVWSPESPSTHMFALRFYVHSKWLELPPESKGSFNVCLVHMFMLSVCMHIWVCTCHGSWLLLRGQPWRLVFPSHLAGGKVFCLQLHIQASWPVSFGGLSYLCLLSHRMLGDCTTSSFVQPLGSCPHSCILSTFIYRAISSVLKDLSSHQ